MTQPPPDDSWADYEHAEDDLTADEFLAAPEEDALIDEVGQGGDVTETPDPEGGVARALRRLRDWGMQDPITTPPWEVHAEKPLPPRHTTGGNVPINEEAQQIRAVANDSSASGAAQLAASNLGDVQFPTIDSDTVGVLQEGISGLENGVNLAASAAGSGSDDEQAIQGAGFVAVQAFGVALQLAEQARAAAESAAQAVQQAKSAAEDALAASEQFRQTCDGIASRHGA